MDDLYRDAADKEGVESAFVFNDNALQRALKRIYEKNFHPMTDIEEDLFNETFRIITKATDEGLSMSSQEVDVSFRQKLDYNNAVFSAFKVHRMQNDIASQLHDSNGVLKPFEQWKKDVYPMLDHHKEHWLRTEYNTAVLRSQRAADWQRFEREKDILPNLEWMKSTSAHPGADHEIYWGVILPIGHPFWNSHCPGDRWNCKCSLESTDEPATAVPGDPNPEDNKPAPGLDNNPGVDGKLFSDSHPYIANGYEGAKDAVKKFIAEKVKEGTVIKVDYESGKELDSTGKFLLDPDYGKRLKTSVRADATEVEENTRAAKALLGSFPKMNIRINEHVLEEGHKNPEYTINGKIADRKGVESEKGIASVFNKAIRQGCETVVIDLDMHLKEKTLKVRDLARYIDWRRNDFESGSIHECYVIYRNRSVRIGKSDKGREEIETILKQLEP